MLAVIFLLLPNYGGQADPMTFLPTIGSQSKPDVELNALQAKAMWRWYKDMCTCSHIKPNHTRRIVQESLLPV